MNWTRIAVTVAVLFPMFWPAINIGKYLERRK